MRHLSRTIALVVALALPGTVLAFPSDHSINLGPSDVTYSPIKTECVKGLVVARSVSTMIQLTSPVTGKVMRCDELVLRDKRIELELSQLKVKQDKLDVEIGELKLKKARLQAVQVEVELAAKKALQNLNGR